MSLAFGTYSFNNTFAQRVHPSLKLFIFILLLVLILLPNGFFGFIIVGAITAGCAYLARLRWRMIWSAIKSIIFLFAVLILINWLVMKSDNLGAIDSARFRPLGGDMPSNLANYTYGSGFWSINDKAIFLSLYVTIKIFFMIIAASLLIVSTSPMELTYGVQDLLSPLRLVGFPVNETAMILSIALRNIPTLVEESQRIMKAQASRGVDFKNGNFKDKISSLISLIVPLFGVAFQKADDLANALESRMYNPRYSRTRYRIFRIRKRDLTVLFLLVTLTALCISWTAMKFYFAPFGNPEAIVLML